MTPHDDGPQDRLTLLAVLTAWWPLAASWAFMGIELPLVSAVMARLPDAAVHLAAYGGLVFPVALIIEAPIIMLLAASTALARDAASYRMLHRFMMIAGGALTAIHAVLAFTPAFDLVLVPLLGPPDDVIEPARLGLQLLLPWTWTIAYRRFHQGLLIRHGLSRAVGIGTAVRLAAVAAVAGTGLAWNAVHTSAESGFGSGLELPGVAVAALAISAGVSAEALYTGLRTRRVVRERVVPSAVVGPPLRWSGFASFYLPLALTSLLLLLVQPIGAAAIARMPDALPSLAAWPVVGGLVFLFRSLGMAYNEVVVALLDRPGADATLRRFTAVLVLATAAAATAMAATPASLWWFGTVSGLPPDLAALARDAFWLGMVWAPLDVLRNDLQGRLVHARRTRGIGESVAVFLTVATTVLVMAVQVGTGSGLVWAMSAFVAGSLAQIGWLAWHLRRDRATATRVTAAD